MKNHRELACKSTANFRISQKNLRFFLTTFAPVILNYAYETFVFDFER